MSVTNKVYYDPNEDIVFTFDDVFEGMVKDQRVIRISEVLQLTESQIIKRITDTIERYAIHIGDL